MAAARSAGDEKLLDESWFAKKMERPTKTVSRMSALISCYNHSGQQVAISNLAMGDSFTGIQDLFRACIQLGHHSLDPDHVGVTFLRVGPSSFDFQFEMRDAKSVKLWDKHPSGWDMTTYVALDQALATFAALGHLSMTIAAHPGCELRLVETVYGADIAVLVDGSPCMVTDAQLLYMVQDPVVQDALRTAMVPLADPEFEYVIIRGEVQGAMGMFYLIMASNDHLREFVAGGPLEPLSFEPTVVCPSAAEIRWNEDRR